MSASVRELSALEELPADSLVSGFRKACRPICQDGAGHILRGLPPDLFFLVAELGEDAEEPPPEAPSVFLGALAATAGDNKE